MAKGRYLGKIITAAVILLLAAGGFLAWKLSVSVPSGATLGGLSGGLVEKENRVTISVFQQGEDGKAQQYTVPLKMYIFRPDGGLTVAVFDEERSAFVTYEPCYVYFVKDDTIYVATTYQHDGQMKDIGQWKVIYKFKVVGGKPYIDDTYIPVTGDEVISYTEDEMTWAEFSSRISAQNAGK